MKQGSKSTLNKFPRIGMRMIKSVIAVFVCFVIGMLRGAGSDVFQSVLSTLFCVQQRVTNSKKAAYAQISGTLIGAAYGIVAVLAEDYLFPEELYAGIVGYMFIALMIIPVIYTTILLKKRDLAYFSCVVFLVIALSRTSQTAPVYIFNRVLDTMIGVFVAIGINAIKLPRKYNNDVLFVADLDDTLLSMKELFSPYSKVELNRMLEEGAKFSLMTHRTPASLVEVIGEIKLNLPVIAMDGSVLYDISENQYIKAYVISPSTVEKLQHFLNSYGLNCFINTIIGDIMLTFCQEEMTINEKILYKKYKKSPYRHYVKGTLPKGQDAVYIMVVATKEQLDKVVEAFEKQEFATHLKMVRYETEDFAGFQYLRIYNKNASKENMIKYIKEYLKVSEVITFGSVQDDADIVVDNNVNEVVRVMKKLYKPLRRIV